MKASVKIFIVWIEIRPHSYWNVHIDETILFTCNFFISEAEWNTNLNYIERVITFYELVLHRLSNRSMRFFSFAIKQKYFFFPGITSYTRCAQLRNAHCDAISREMFIPCVADGKLGKSNIFIKLFPLFCLVL